MVGDQAADNLYRCYGDLDGNRFVNIFDFFEFQAAFLAMSASPRFQAGFDNNDDGFINVFDFFDFQANFLKMLNFSD